MAKLPSARELADSHGHVDIGEYRVAYNPLDQQQDFAKWHIRGPEDSAGFRPVIDSFSRYADAIKEARRLDRAATKARRHALWHRQGASERLLQACKEAHAFIWTQHGDLLAMSDQLRAAIRDAEPSWEPDAFAEALETDARKSAGKAVDGG